MPGIAFEKIGAGASVLDDVLKAWEAPNNPESVRDLKPKKARKPGVSRRPGAATPHEKGRREPGNENRLIARHTSVKIHAFMPLASAIVAPDKFDKGPLVWIFG